jgi:2-polyprenyl-3-methyl-5-hydroxy-6-metoxy-1,4-benzoquinol methylase
MGEKKITFLEENEVHETLVKTLKSCPLCDSENNHHVRTERCEFPTNAHPEVVAFNNVWIHLLECDDCSFAFTQQIPTSPTFFHNRYDNKNFDPEYEVKSNRKHIIFDEIFSLLKKEGKESGEFLDIGSFAGKLLKYASDNGFHARGVEVNPKLAHYTKEILGIDVFNGKVQEVDLPKGEFDVITIIDVLEHLEDPKIIVQRLSDSLKEDGVLVIKVPHYNMQAFKQNIANAFGISPVGIFQSFGHINHFNQSSLQHVANDCGLELKQSYNAKSEHWPNDSIINRAKNLFRDFYWHLSNAVISLTGTDIGLNTIYVLKKK